LIKAPFLVQMVFGLLDVPSPTFATDFSDMIERIEHTQVRQNPPKFA